ncbi:MAG: recombinase family protein [Ktedonobacterales bacterium]|nr:recombinase family protein [Ktedonobacterales bacterium]
MPRHKQAQGMFDAQRWELPVGSRVWVYLRHSPGDNQTIESQMMGVQQWCEKEQWIIERMFIDEAQQGSKEHREQFQEMMALSRQQPRLADGIVIWSFSRFARNQLDSQFYKADLRKRGFVVASKVDEIPNNELAPVIEAFVDWKNQRYLDDLSTDVKRGQHYMVEQGFWVSSHVPMGYRIEKVEFHRRHTGEIRYGNRLVKDEAAAERVALAWQMKLRDNASFKEIYKATRLFTRFTHYGFFFSNLIYAGIFDFGGSRYPSTWEDGGHFCEPYVTMDEFLQVQENRRKRAVPFAVPRTLSSSYLLSGMVRCGLCAERGRASSLVGGKSTGSNYRFYRCAVSQFTHPKECEMPRKPSWYIEEAVVNLLREVVFTPDYIATEVERANELLSESQRNMTSQISEATTQVQVHQKRVESLLQLIGTSGVTTLLQKEYDRANTAWLEATSRLASLRSESVSVQARKLDINYAYKVVDEMLEVLEQGAIAQQRELIARFVEYVNVFPDHIDVYLRFSIDDRASMLTTITARQDQQLRPIQEVNVMTSPGA